MAWSDNDELIDDQGQRPKKSKAPPALDGQVSSTQLLMAHLGDTSDQIWYSTLQRGSRQWGSDRQALALRSKIAPALAGGLMVFRDAGSGRLFRASFSGAGWAFDEQNPELRDAQGNTPPTDIHPALASTGGDLTHLMIWNHSGSRMRHLLVRNGRLLDFSENIGDPTQGVYGTKTRPAVALTDNVLHVVHLGAESNQLWHALGTLSFDAAQRLTVQWRAKKIGGQKSRATPALAVFNGRLHMVHLGDSSTTLWHAIYVPEADGWTQDEIGGQKSKATPGLAAFDGKLHMVHLGEQSNQIWWSTWEDN